MHSTAQSRVKDALHYWFVEMIVALRPELAGGRDGAPAWLVGKEIEAMLSAFLGIAPEVQSLNVRARCKEVPYSGPM